MNYPIEKYQFIRANNKVIALSSFAGRPVRGIAKCDPRDKFNPAVGEEIAAARCALKIARKRQKLADAKYAQAREQLAMAQYYEEGMRAYSRDAEQALYDAEYELQKLLSKH